MGILKHAWSRVTLTAIQVNYRRLVQRSARISSLGSGHISQSEESEMELSKVLKRLHKIASPTLAGSWDNVGLLVEPSPPHLVTKVFLTNDLTPPVLQEAIEKKSNLILCYHPPIFSPLTRLTQKKWKEEIIVKCIENRIAVYSPHTSYDCVQGGVNDWLINCFDCQDVRPVEPHEELPSNHTHVVSFNINVDKYSNVLSALDPLPEVRITESKERSDGKSHISLQCAANSLRHVVKVIEDASPGVSNLASTALAKVPKLGYGMGRRGTLSQPISVDKAVATVKQHLGLDHVRLATPPGKPEVTSVAVCAGSGSSVLRNVPTSLYVTGEMSHHDVLHAVYNGTSVILCEHSNTERGYLTILQTRLQESLAEGTEVLVSQVDADPLKVV